MEFVEGIPLMGALQNLSYDERKRVLSRIVQLLGKTALVDGCFHGNRFINLVIPSSPAILFVFIGLLSSSFLSFSISIMFPFILIGVLILVTSSIALTMEKYAYWILAK